jgi:hypothetical protein
MRHVSDAVSIIVVVVVIRFNSGWRQRNRQCGQSRHLWWECWLYVVEFWEARLTTDWSIVKVSVSCRAHFNDEHRKEHVETQAVHSNEATSMLVLMGMEAVQWISKVRNMETIPDQNLLPIQRDDGRSIPMDWSK